MPAAGGPLPAASHHRPADLRWEVSGAAAGDRLDRAVAARYGLPRNQVQRWIRKGAVTLNGSASKPSQELAAGDRIDCHPPQAPPHDIQPEPGALTVLHEDQQVVAIDKPAGITVHPGAGRAAGTLAHLLLAHYPEMAAVGGPGRPGIVHRLDRGTSGVLLVARTPHAYLRLSRAFAARDVAKRYLALVYGAPEPAAGEIERPIGRHRERRKEMTVRSDGRPALTRYRTLAAAGGIALLDIDLATGRTHQVRVHMKSVGHPLVGDPVYGEARWRALTRESRGPLSSFSRPALHAWQITFPHPDDGHRVHLAAPVPEDLRQLWEEVTGHPWPLREPPPARQPAESHGFRGQR